MLLYARRIKALILLSCFSCAFHQAPETDSEESKKVNREEDMDQDDITDDSDSD